MCPLVLTEKWSDESCHEFKQLLFGFSWEEDRAILDALDCIHSAIQLRLGLNLFLSEKIVRFGIYWYVEFWENIAFHIWKSYHIWNDNVYVSLSCPLTQMLWCICSQFFSLFLWGTETGPKLQPSKVSDVWTLFIQQCVCWAQRYGDRQSLRGAGRLKAERPADRVRFYQFLIQRDEGRQFMLGLSGFVIYGV